ncbi:MAG TPA: ABC transporter substrate-binding protein [Microlunatus sp.]
MTGLRMNRRRLLGIAAVGGAAAITGCSIDTGSQDVGGAKTQQNLKKISIPDYPGELPKGEVTFRWTDSGDLKSVFEEGVLDAYSKKHANIKTHYQGSGWDTVNQEIPLGIRNKSAPDIFAVPDNVPAATAVNEGWVHPLEDIVPDFDNWKANFGENAFIPGVHVFDGKTYSWPMSSNHRLGYMSFYDVDNMKAAGYDDPVGQIKTWDDLYAALKKVKKNGNVGMMVGGDALAGVVSFLANSVGWHGLGGLTPVGGMDLATGKYVYSDPKMVQAFDFMQKLATDKLLVPGYLNLLQADARAQMTSGKAGVIFNGPWDLPAWKQTAPDWKYDMGIVPSPDGQGYVNPYQETGANNPWVYKETKYPTVAGHLMAYMGSTDGQRMQVILSEGNLRSLIPKANEQANQSGLLDEHAKRAAALADQILRTAPLVQIRNPDYANVLLSYKAVQPAWTDLMQGIFTGQLKNAAAQFKKMDSASEQALEDALTAAAKKGSSLTRDDFVFSNWDPTKNYTADDYKSLG